MTRTRLAGVLIACIVTLAAGLACCTASAQNDQPPSVYIESFGGNYSVYRITDTRYGVVCYGRTGYEGVSCIALDSTQRRAK